MRAILALVYWACRFCHLAACGGGGGGGSGGSGNGGGNAGNRVPAPPPDDSLLLSGESLAQNIWRAGEALRWTITFNQSVEANSVAEADFRFDVVASAPSAPVASGAFVLGSEQDGDQVGDNVRTLLEVDRVYAVDLSGGFARSFVLVSEEISSDDIGTGEVRLGIFGDAKFIKFDGGESGVGVSAALSAIARLGLTRRRLFWRVYLVLTRLFLRGMFATITSDVFWTCGGGFGGENHYDQF